MITNIFRWVYLLFLIVLALVVGGACYQTVSINPYWLNDVAMFRNYQWGIGYFPILSPLMTMLWLALLIMGFKIKLPNKKVLYTAHLFFLLIIISTFSWFAPFLLTYMGHPENSISNCELIPMIATWSKWDRIRQATGLVPLALFIYYYGKFQVTGSNVSSIL
ncbi:MAG: hypothetical protein V4685_02980 [Bacteroidota bacterium]